MLPDNLQQTESNLHTSNIDSTIVAKLFPLLFRYI